MMRRVAKPLAPNSPQLLQPMLQNLASFRKNPEETPCLLQRPSLADRLVDKRMNTYIQNRQGRWRAGVLQDPCSPLKYAS